MKNISFWVSIIFGVILILISIFIAIIVLQIFLGNTSIFGINPELVGLFFIGSDGSSSMVPIFFGLLSLSGAILLTASFKQKN